MSCSYVKGLESILKGIKKDADLFREGIQIPVLNKAQATQMNIFVIMF